MHCALLLVVGVAAHGARKPAPFPPAASYDCTLTTTAKSKLCAECAFAGRHYYNSDRKKEYGSVSWVYGPANATEKTNFMDVFHGAAKKMFLVQDGPDGLARCAAVDFPAPVFNRSWAAGAVYIGTAFFHGRLAHRFDGVFPYFVQGEVESGAYFEDVFTSLPLGFNNSLAELRYGENFSPATPPDAMFTAIDQVACAPPPPPRGAAAAA